MESIKCQCCKIEKARDEFHKNRFRKNGLSHYCKMCKKAAAHKEYSKHKEHYESKKREYRKNNPIWYKEQKLRDRKKRYQRFLAFIDALKNKPCIDCCNKFPPECMDFDHVRGAKVKNISQMHTLSKQRLLEEIAKCELICSNCHRIRTRKRMSKCYLEL